MAHKAVEEPLAFGPSDTMVRFGCAIPVFLGVEIVNAALSRSLDHSAWSLRIEAAFPTMAETTSS
jgi:hypothetical protein